MIVCIIWSYVHYYNEGIYAVEHIHFIRGFYEWPCIWLPVETM